MKCVKLTVYHESDSNSKVPAIKVWRIITGLDLKTSKDFIDTIFAGGYSRRVAVVLNMAKFGELSLMSKVDIHNSGLVFGEADRYEKSQIIDFSDN